MKKKTNRCGICRKAPALPAGLLKARLEDIPDGSSLRFPSNRVCEKCLEKIAEECMVLAEEG